MTNCNKDCCKVGYILYSDEYEGCADAEEQEGETLIKYEAYDAIYGGEYGHINYALASYCVYMGHIECLRNIYNNTDMQWHADLADCAIEKDNLECLKFIVEVMGDVTIDSKEKNVGKNCEEYFKNLKNKNIKKHRE